MIEGSDGMHIVDSQVHIWGADTPARPWPPGRAHQAQKPSPVTKDLVLAAMKEAGVDRVVLVPPSWEGDRNDLALDAARLHPDRFGVMGRLAIEQAESQGLGAALLLHGAVSLPRSAQAHPTGV